VLGVSLDEMEVEKFRSWIAARDIDWPQVLDKQHGASQLASAYSVGPVPFHVVIDREGTIVAAGVDVREIERVVIEELHDQGAGARLQPERLSADVAGR
jgi:peroxiredoxin